MNCYGAKIRAKQNNMLPVLQCLEVMIRPQQVISDRVLARSKFFLSGHIRTKRHHNYESDSVNEAQFMPEYRLLDLVADPPYHLSYIKPIMVSAVESFLDLCVRKILQRKGVTERNYGILFSLHCARITTL